MTLNLEPHPTWDIKDSSKLETFLSCRRKYFFEYILGWRVNAPAPDLVFGEAFHKAREHQIINGYSDIDGAYNAFMECYRQSFPSETDDMYKPKNPTGALNAIQQFAIERMSDLYENEVVELDGQKMIEVAGTVMVDDKRCLHYRMDSIMRRKEDGKIFSWDHKTTKRISRQWREKFHLSLQNGTYTHCLYCMFPIEDVLGIEFCGTCFEHLTRGSKYRPAGYYTSFERVPAFKTPDQMNTWLWTVNDLLDDLEIEMSRLYNCSESEPVMMAFPMNPTSCTDYWGCPYLDYCQAWQNPLQQSDEPPLGFKTEWWNPGAVETRVKKNLEFLGGSNALR